ncbi:helix-turn-helix domain-containing protein [Crocosphaera sp. Alani8]|uniref:helix-turn-helix domain-containing protein n=1 Tax=Crocosphaera sp. Alani8 TaxID=3038952 RepID=UPI00313D0B8C
MIKATPMKVTKTVEKEVPNLGKRIYEARMRDRRALTQLCGLVGMSTQNWYRIESERQSVPIETLRKMEKALGIDLGVSFDD